MNDLVSVCVPVYNGAKYIQETLDSVSNQTYKNLEIIVQDNCSTDDTVEVVEQLAAKDPRIRLNKNSLNYGMSGNWNVALRHATGRYLMLLSADDLLLPLFVERGVEALEQEDIAVVTTNHYLLRHGALEPRREMVSAGTYQNFSGIILLKNPFSINFTLFKRETLKKFEQYGQLMGPYLTCDYDLNLRIALSGLKLKYLTERLGSYRVHDANLSRNVRKMSRQAALTVLSNRESLQKVATVAYHFTLARFILRCFVHKARGARFDGRLARTLFSRLFS